MTTQRRYYWKIVFEELGSLKCIFTGSELSANTYVLDHFIPHTFVSHDLIWNLIPVDTGFNNAKSDRLPSLDEYFDEFFLVQKTAYEIILQRTPQNKLLADI